MYWTTAGLFPGDVNPPTATQSNWVSGVYDNFGDEAAMKQLFTDKMDNEENFLLSFEARVNIITAGDYEFEISADDEMKILLEEKYIFVDLGPND